MNLWPLATQFNLQTLFSPWRSLSESKMLGHVQLFATPCTVARQALLSMEFSRQEYWSGLSNPFPGDHPDPGIEPASPEAPVLAGGFFTT